MLSADTIVFANAPAFDAWLAKNHTLEAGIWIKMAKKSSGIPSITSDEAVDVGLCWGWISGVRKSLDDSYYLQKYVPRRPRSVWSQVNVRKVEALMAAGRMHPSGLAEVEAAKADGRWDAAYVSQREATAPPDLLKALAHHKAAAATFDQYNKTEQYAVILRLVTARTPQARAARLTQLTAELAARRNIVH
jgi:uncharacterized protein YdeI (YjbR/CyaY-like superfamily)